MSEYAEFAEMERRGWSDPALASGYIDFFSATTGMTIADIAAELAPGMRVLDLCCGQGDVARALLERGHEVVGADFSATMLAIARKRVEGAELVQADAQSLPFGDGEFDAVVSNFGIVHVPDQTRALREARRVLRDGGRFAMTAWHGPDVSKAFRLVYGTVGRLGSQDVALPDGPDFHRFADAGKAGALLADCGLRLTDHRRIDCHFSLAAPQQLYATFERGAPRSGYLLSRQPESNRDAIARAITSEVEERFGEGDGWRVPIPAAIVSAVAA